MLIRASCPNPRRNRPFISRIGCADRNERVEAAPPISDRAPLPSGQGGNFFFVREVNLINNRQGGRRRGRGGQRGPNLGGQPGNRQDNRQRGNAAQLLEKYKSMARDSQLAGDRVQTEYYLQYADHYFRVVNENRSRFEEQRPRRDSEDDEGDDEQLEAAESEDSGDDRAERVERQDRGDRPDRGAQRDRRPRERNRYDGDDQAASDRDEDRAPRSRRVNGGEDEDAIPLDVLPPAIGADGPATTIPNDEPEEPAQRAPARRRARSPRPAADDDGEVAPAA